VARHYTAGDIEVRPDERRVLVGGQAAALGARAFDLLMCLIEHRDRVVTKDELLAQVWPGSVVEESNLTVHVSALRKLLGAQSLATVPGRGYRFAMNLSETDVGAPLTTGAALVAPPLPDKPSIAVMAFDNLSHDPQQDAFIDGICEDIITELSRFSALFVIARNSSFSYKGRAVDVRTIARELGVRYVVEGSIRGVAGRVRVTAQLVDASSGEQLWAERYDRALEDIFAVQEALTQAIVAAIAPQVESFEQNRVRKLRRLDLSAYELALRARDLARWADKEADPALRDEALQLAHSAVAIDPACGSALRTIAYLNWQQVWADTCASRDSAVEEGLAAARRALGIDSGDHLAHLWKGMLLLYSDQYEAGLADLRRAHELNPNDALTLSLLGHFEAGAGNAAIGIQHVTDALRLSPRDTLRWSYLNSLAWAHFAAGDYAQATDAALRAVGDAPRFYPPHVCLVISRVGLGATGQAMADFKGLNAMAAQPTAQRLAGRWVCSSVELAQRATTFLRIAAGLENPAAAHAPCC
jgi:TolB-like protein